MHYFISLFLLLLSTSSQAQSKLVLNSTNVAIGTIPDITFTRLPSGSYYDLAGLSDKNICYFKFLPNEAGDSLRYEYFRAYGDRMFDEKAKHGLNIGAEGKDPINSKRLFDLLKVQDVDEDGLMDLIVLLEDEKEIHWCKNEGFARFSQPVSLAESAVSMKGLRNYKISGQNVVYKFDGAVGFINLTDPTQSILQESKTIDPYYLAGVADMNNDELSDFILFNEGELSLLMGSDKSKVAKDALIPTGVKLQDAYYSCYADMNNDGLIDILNTYNNTIEVFFNEGNGSFSAPKRIVDELIVQDNIADELYDYDLDWSINTFDYDKDGDQDVIAFGVYLMLITNNGNGTYGIRQLGSRAYDADELIIDDMDLDGDLDLVYNSYEGLAFIQNTKDGFKELQTLEICSYIELMFWVDMDQDGDKDLLLKDACSQLLYWSEQTKEGLLKPVVYQVAKKDL